MTGLCKCGCGQKTGIAPYNRTARGWIKGQPLKYLHGHNMKKWKGDVHPSWKGGVIVNNKYVYVHVPNHPHANVNGRVAKGKLVVEKIIGKYLPKEAVIHHIDGNPSNNTNSNIIACEDHSYHRLLHIRKRAYDACGNPNWRNCSRCKKFDKIENLVIHGTLIMHRKCKNEYLKEWRKKKKIRGLALAQLMGNG